MTAMWFKSPELAGNWYRGFETGKINFWLDNPGEDLYIKLVRGKMAGTTVRVVRDTSYASLDDWYNIARGCGRDVNLKVFDGTEVKTVRFSVTHVESNTVGGSAYFYICNDFDPDKPELGKVEDESPYPVRQDMFGIGIEVGSVIHVQIYNMGVFAVVEGYNPKSIQIKPIEWNDTLVGIFQGKSIAWTRNTDECFVVDKELPDRLLLARLTGSSE